MARAVRRIGCGCKFDGDGLDRLGNGPDAGARGIGSGIKSAERRGDGLARLPGLWQTAVFEGLSDTSDADAGG